MRYPLRGQGALLLLAYVGLLALLPLTAIVPGAGLAAFFVEIAIALLVPGLLYAIVRRTAEGDDEMPDWPDFAEGGERLRETLTFLGTAAMALAPAGLALVVSGCDLSDVLRVGEDSAACWLALAAGLTLGLPLAIPMFGALAIYGNLDLLLRLDLHARALAAARRDALGAILVAYASCAAGQLLAHGLARFPILGGALAAGATAYGSFVAAHVVGLMFRRHAAALDAIYLP